MKNLKNTKNSSLLITGGTGSFGNALADYLSKKRNFKKIIIFSRDEMKHWYMKNKFSDDPRFRFFIGDVRDKERLHRALNSVDYVIHAAATKIVESAEYNPFECVKTNIIGAMNVIDASIDNKVKKVIALSTDKASSPFNLYGGTKLVSDKLFIAGNYYSENKDTIFSVVRYGNVLGSRGSILKYLQDLKKNNSFRVDLTHTEMTRFVITLDQAVSFVLFAFNDMKGGETYIKKLPSIKIIDLIYSIIPNAKLKVVGIRSGEKIHEEMISSNDSKFTYEYSDHFKILPSLFDIYKNKKLYKNGKLVADGFSYNSLENENYLNSKNFKNIYNKIANSL